MKVELRSSTGAEPKPVPAKADPQLADKEKARIRKMACKDFLWEWDLLKDAGGDSVYTEFMPRIAVSMYAQARSEAGDVVDGKVWPASKKVFKQSVDQCRDNPQAPFYEGVFKSFMDSAVQKSGRRQHRPCTGSRRCQLSLGPVVKEMQRHPDPAHRLDHIDFLQVNMNEEITVHIAVRLEGESKAVAAIGGLVDAAVDNLEVSCTPTNMPNEFVIDITDMQPDTVIRLSDIPMPKGVTPLGDPDMPVVTVLTTAAEIEEPAAPAEGEEGEEGEAGDASAAGAEASTE